MGHFVAENDAWDAIGKGFAGQDFGVHGFMMKVLAGDAQGYIEHSLPRQVKDWAPPLKAGKFNIII